MSATGLSLLIAQYVAPMDQPPIRDGAVAFSDGIIRAVGRAADLRREYPAANTTVLGAATLLPGLVNAHVHLELSSLSPGDPPAHFVDWLKRLVPQSPPSPQAAAAFATRGIETGVRECIGFGVTAVGDISRQCAVTRPLLKNGPLTVVSYGEVQAMARRRGLLEERIAMAADRRDASDCLRIGITPHAPYSVESAGYRRCLRIARDQHLPLATHLAETPHEAPFLNRHEGPFRDLWNYLNAWDDAVPTYAGGPIAFAHDMGLLDYPSLLAHVNYCDDREMALLAAGRASVVYCPRTHAYFGHPPHRWQQMLRSGINVAVGTDSRASSPDLNLVDDLRLLRQIAPDEPAITLWEMATLRAARAIGCQDTIGSLFPNKRADLIAFPIAGQTPLEAILESNLPPHQVWIGGNTHPAAPRVASPAAHATL